MKRKLTAIIMTIIAGAAMLTCFASCDDDSSSTTATASKSDNKDYGGYSKEYWDAARDAWDNNT